jgi:membrane-anchored mycosin MYCP
MPRQSSTHRRSRRGLVRLALALAMLAALVAPAGCEAAATTLQSTGSGNGGAGIFGGAGPERCTPPSGQVQKAIPWAQNRLTPKRVWPLTRGEEVVVAVIDTGVSASVPQLTGKVLPGFDVINPGGGRADDDCFGHGTFVAGIIAAEPRAGTGLSGVAPGARILPIRQANSAQDGTAAGMATGIRAAVDGGADIINISASSFFPSPALQDAVSYATVNDVLIVAAASNEAQEGNPKAYPAAYPEVLSVGAIDRDGNISEFSETGDFLDLVAPGVNIAGLSRLGGGHVEDSGTSYAAPFVAGVAALVRAYHPELTAAEVKRRLELTADHPGTVLPDKKAGWGVVNPYAAVTTTFNPAGGIGRPGPTPIDVRLRTAAGDDHAKAMAAAVGGIGALATLAVMGAAVVVPRGARRGWAPARRSNPGRSAA